MTAPMSDEKFTEIAARAVAASPGPWGSRRSLEGVYEVQARPRITPTEGNTHDGDIALVYTTTGEDQTYANARFIALAREAVPELLNEVERLGRTFAILQAVLNSRTNGDRTDGAVLQQIAGIVARAEGVTS